MKIKELFHALSSGAVVAAGVMGGCHRESAPSAPPPTPAVKPAEPVEATKPVTAAAPDHPFAKAADYDAQALSTVEQPTGLKVEDLIVGEGPTCLPMAVVTFHYRAKVQGGAEFDATAERPEPAPETQGMKRMMQGLQDGIVGMKVGGRRRLTIPPGLAFGNFGARDPQGNEVVPPDSTVIFIIDLLDLKQGIVVPGATGPAPSGGKKD
jgi:peptidylprolyl isomerase